MTVTTTPQTANTAITKPRISRHAAPIVAMMMGASIIFMIGFSHIGVVHNAAHDTRHSFAFPCH